MHYRGTMISAAAIKSARDRLRESQTVFAARFGVDQATLSRWERGIIPTTGPAMALIERVLAELGSQEAAE
jgi:DNA-binding transcriptional regulator YiaG